MHDRIIGDTAQGRDGQYARIASAAQSALLDMVLEVPGDATGWADKTVADIPSADVAEVEIIHPDGRDPQHWGGRKAAEMAFGTAGVSPKDVDTAQLYDAFSPRVIHDLVAYGFCTPEDVGGFRSR